MPAPPSCAGPTGLGRAGNSGILAALANSRALMASTTEAGCAETRALFLCLRLGLISQMDLGELVRIDSNDALRNCTCGRPGVGFPLLVTCIKSLLLFGRSIRHLLLFFTLRSTLLDPLISTSLIAPCSVLIKYVLTSLCTQANSHEWMVLSQCRLDLVNGSWNLPAPGLHLLPQLVPRHSSLHTCARAC